MADKQKDGTITGMEHSSRCTICGKQEKRNYYIGFFNSTDIYSCEAHYKELDYHYIGRKRRANTNLHRVVDSYEDSKTHRQKKITHGKAWEIEHRTLAEDGKTVINSKTGKEAEY